MSKIAWQITELEQGPFQYAWDTSINPAAPDRFDIQPVPNGVQIFCGGKADAGALAKAVNQLPAQSSTITFRYAVTLDSSIAYAQVIETDTKITDAAGWTYDGSLQFNIAKGWMLQIGNPWKDTSVKIPLQQGLNEITVQYALDYVAHTITVFSVNRQALNQPAIPAAQVGWAVSEIVTQLQLCLAAAGGTYGLLFGAMSYQGTQ